PAVCEGTLVLNGTCRRPGILPRIVAGRGSPRNSPAIFWLTSGPAHVASVTVPGATAALRYNATSGVESSHRFAYSAASRLLPLHSRIAHVARINAVPGATLGRTEMVCRLSWTIGAAGTGV